MAILVTRLAATDLLLRDFKMAMESNLLMPKPPIEIYRETVVRIMIQDGSALFLTEDDEDGIKMAHGFSRYPKLGAWTGYDMGVLLPLGMAKWEAPCLSIVFHAAAAIRELNETNPAEFMVVTADKVAMNSEVEADRIAGDVARAAAFEYAGFGVREIIHENMAFITTAYKREGMTEAEAEKLKVIREGYDA